MGIVIIARLLVAYFLGLLAPGIPLSMYFGIRPYWCGAFVLSWLSLVIGVISFQLVGIPITFGGLSAWQVIVMLVGIFAVRYGGRRVDPTDGASVVCSYFTRSQRNILIGTIVAMGFVMAVRVTKSPLSGFDTIFRWEFLAKQMLAESNLDFYPPMTAEDYCIYVFPDGIAPVVSSVYWWLYAANGQPAPVITSGFVLIQWAVVIGFSWQLAKNLSAIPQAACFSRFGY